MGQPDSKSEYIPGTSVEDFLKSNPQVQKYSDGIIAGEWFVMDDNFLLEELRFWPKVLSLLENHPQFQEYADAKFEQEPSLEVLLWRLEAQIEIDAIITKNSEFYDFVHEIRKKHLLFNIHYVEHQLTWHLKIKNFLQEHPELWMFQFPYEKPEEKFKELNEQLFRLEVEAAGGEEAYMEKFWWVSPEKKNF